MKVYKLIRLRYCYGKCGISQISCCRKFGRLVITWINCGSMLTNTTKGPPFFNLINGNHGNFR